MAVKVSAPSARFPDTTQAPDTILAAEALPEDPPDPGASTGPRPIGLFWRTFFLLSVILTSAVLLWTRTLLEQELEPRAIQTAREIGSIVNLVRAVVQNVDPIGRVALFKSMKDLEHVVIQPREPNDRVAPLNDAYLFNYVRDELQSRLGTTVLLAESVNDMPGLWIGFPIEQDAYWLQTDLSRYQHPAQGTWLLWLSSAALLSLLGAAGIARLITRPLHALALAASRVRAGDFTPSALDERVRTREIRDANAGFNRMTAQLTDMERTRAVMLAGISHDLRTPLARLRLELELSVPDEQAREAMATDIAQLDAIISKFLEYARPGDLRRTPVRLDELVRTSLARWQRSDDVQLNLSLQPDLWVLGDPIELQRIVNNLIENARRYGRSPDTGVAVVDVSARARTRSVLLRIRDHGLGVPPEQLGQLTQPFFRGETARTSANGSGLGLAIVDQTVRRMSGSLRLANTQRGGLLIDITLERVPSPPTSNAQVALSND